MEGSEIDPQKGTVAGVSVDLAGEMLLLMSLVTAPWIYGAAEDSVRYALSAVVLVASALLLWPELRSTGLPRGIGPAFALPAFGLIQVLIGQSVAPILTVETALVGFSMALVWASVDARSGTSTNTGRRLAWALLVTCAAEAAFAAFQWSTDKTSLFGQKSEFQTMPFGSYVNHNNFAGLVSLGVPLALAMAIGDVRRSGRLTPRGLGLVGISCGLAIAVMASASRGGTVALAGGLLVLVLISGRLLRRHETHRSWLAPSSVGLAILAAAAFAVPAPTRDRLLSGLTSGSSGEYRVDIGMTSLRAFASRPLLGSGMGAFADAAAPFKTAYGDVRSERAEADVLEFAVEGGAAFLIALVLFGRSVLRWSRDEMLHSRDRGGRWLRAGALSACSTMLFHSLFDFGFRIPANALAFSVLLGIATSWTAPTIRAGPRTRLVVAVILVMAAIVCGYRAFGAAGEKAAFLRTTAESRLDALQSLVDSHPYLDRARRQRGLAWMALAYNRGSYDPTRLERARRDLQAVVSLRPQWGEARADLGWIEYYSGRTAAAKEQFLEATQLDPTHMGLGIAYAQVLAWSGELPAAVKEISRLRAMNPGWSHASARDLAATWTQDPSILLNIP